MAVRFPLLNNIQMDRLADEASQWGNFDTSCLDIKACAVGSLVVVSIYYFGDYHAVRLNTHGVGSEYIVFQREGDTSQEWHFYLNAA